MDHAELLGLLNNVVREHGGTITAWAHAHDLAPSYVHQVMRRRVDPGPKILEALGLRKVVSYDRVR